MKFCRSCGSSLAQAVPAMPAMGAPGFAPVGAPMIGMPPPGPLRTPMPPGPLPPMQGGAMPGAMPAPLPTLPPEMQAPVRLAGPPPMSPAAAAMAVQSTIPGPGASRPQAQVPQAQGSTMTCPRCSTQTPIGFAYCQNCGLHMQPIAPTDPAGARGKPASVPPTIAPGAIIVDPQGATLAADNIRAGSVLPPPSAGAQAQPVVRFAQAAAVASAAAWGTAVLVNRDGSDGARFALASDDTIVGRAGADIAFDDDRFLARQHARISRAADGVKIQALDTTNGVFKKADGPIELADGAIILVGREVLQFERVAAEERTVQPLVRHGVALFGSPPRDPWGRILQLVPSGGYRDVRHLIGDEVVLGREEGDVVFRDDAFMSRRHAALTWDGKRAQVTDLGSSNGTFVRVTAPVALKHGDHVRIGDQLLRIEITR